LAVQGVAGADLDLVEAIENIELGQREAIDAAGADGLTHQHGVEPADSPLASRVDAEFPATPADLFPNVVQQFRRKRPLADPGRISLADTEHIADPARPHAGSRRR